MKNTKPVNFWSFCYHEVINFKGLQSWHWKSLKETMSIQINCCKAIKDSEISGSHGGKYADQSFLEYGVL
jgi:hypothetical protein